MLKLNEEDAITLVEILLALTILTSVLISLLGVFAQSTMFIKYSDIQEIALMIAQEEIEELKDISYENIQNSEKIITKDNYPDFTSDIEVVSSTNFIKEIEVEVSWNSNGSHSILLKTKIARR